MAISYPVDCDSPRKKTEWLYRAQELLRLIHNGFSKWYHEGLTQTQYDKFPQKVKLKYPYKTQIVEEVFSQFITDDFMPRSNKICTQINIQRRLLKESIVWTIDVGDI